MSRELQCIALWDADGRTLLSMLECVSPVRLCIPESEVEDCRIKHPNVELIVCPSGYEGKAGMVRYLLETETSFFLIYDKGSFRRAWPSFGDVPKDLTPAEAYEVIQASAYVSSADGFRLMYYPSDSETFYGYRPFLFEGCPVLIGCVGFLEGHGLRLPEDVNMYWSQYLSALATHKSHITYSDARFSYKVYKDPKEWVMVDNKEWSRLREYFGEVVEVRGKALAAGGFKYKGRLVSPYN